MPFITTYEITACVDCVMAAVNDEWPDREAEYREAARLYVAGVLVYRPVQEPQPLARLLDNERLVTNGAGDDDAWHFSWSSCQACGSRLGGDRTTCTVFVEA